MTVSPPGDDDNGAYDTGADDAGADDTGVNNDVLEVGGDQSNTGGGAAVPTYMALLSLAGWITLRRRA